MLAPYWLFVLGGLFIAVTLLLPKGVVGTWRDWRAKRREKAEANPAPDLPPAAAPKPAE
jgi:urea transport system permease protein